MVGKRQRNTAGAVAASFDVILFLEHAICDVGHFDRHRKPPFVSLADCGYQCFESGAVTGAGSFHNIGARRAGFGVRYWPGIIFNYWYWPLVIAARGIGTTLFHFIFFGPSAKNESRT